MREAALTALYDELAAQGVDVILDDRDMRPGRRCSPTGSSSACRTASSSATAASRTGEVEYVCRRTLDSKEMLPVAEAAKIVAERVKTAKH